MTKRDLLEFLKINQDKYISGEELATHFGVTRAGVWKHIKKLQEEGVKIEGITNKGYKLSQSLLCKEDIIAEISKSDISAVIDFGGGFECEVFESIDSTNTYIKTLPETYTRLVCASHQTAGRGRKGNQFYSPKNTGVYFSIAFAPTTSQTNIYTVAAAVAVCKVLSEISRLETKIKWVNDIYLQNKKICGILTEGTFDFENGVLSQVIVGIGINLETDIFPDEIQNKAGSLGVSCNHNEIISKVVNEFFKTLALPKLDIIAEYSKNSLVLGKDVEFLWNGEKQIAKAKYFNLEGNLICENNDKTFTLKAGEISLVSGFLN